MDHTSTVGREQSQIRVIAVVYVLIPTQDRILATCDAHNLEYITDSTNFQPDITLRNALRHVIHGKPLVRVLHDFGMCLLHLQSVETPTYRHCG
jgi:hypothetical protein